MDLIRPAALPLEAASRLISGRLSPDDPKEPISLKLLITLNMHIEPRVSLVEMGMLFVAGIAIFQVWKLFEPRRKGRSPSLMDAIVKPAAVITGAVSFVFGAFFGLFASFAAKV